MVFGYLFCDPREKEHLGHGVAAFAEYFLQRRLAHEAQAYAGNDGARRK